MRLYFTESFKMDYQKLPQQIQKRVDKRLGFLLKDPSYPSLGCKKMKDPRGIWEAGATGKSCGFLMINLGRNFPQKLQEVSKPVGFQPLKMVENT